MASEPESIPHKKTILTAYHTHTNTHTHTHTHTHIFIRWEPDFALNYFRAEVLRKKKKTKIMVSGPITS